MEALPVMARAAVVAEPAAESRWWVLHALEMAVTMWLAAGAAVAVAVALVAAAAVDKAAVEALGFSLCILFHLKGFPSFMGTSSSLALAVRAVRVVPVVPEVSAGVELLVERAVKVLQPHSVPAEVPPVEMAAKVATAAAVAVVAAARVSASLSTKLAGRSRLTPSRSRILFYSKAKVALVDPAAPALETVAVPARRESQRVSICRH